MVGGPCLEKEQCVLFFFPFSYTMGGGGGIINLVLPFRVMLYHNFTVFCSTIDSSIQLYYYMHKIMTHYANLM